MLLARSFSGNEMLLTVENLGPLKQASIDLSKELIVLAGPNNTGKTYMAWTAFGLHRQWPFKQLLKFFEPIMDDMLVRGASELDITHFMRDHGQQLGEILAHAYAEQFPRDFGVESDHFRNTRLALHFNADQLHGGLPKLVFFVLAGHLGGLYRTSGHSLRFLMFGPSEPESTVEDIRRIETQLRDGTFSPDAFPPLAFSEYARSIRRDTLVFALTRILTDMVFPPCTIFPAERIATSLFARELSAGRTELVDELLERAASPGTEDAEAALDLLRKRAQRYPLPIRASLRMAMDLERASREHSEFADLAADIERAIMGGKVTLSEYGQIAFAPDSAPETRIGVHVTASVVKSLSSLVFHLRHQAREGERLIIDEPELNLHPDNQRKMARLLVKAVNRGLRIMVSTHSDYLIRELNNLVMLSQPGEAIARVRGELGYSDSELLAPDKLGVYFFEGGTNRAVPVDQRGFEIETIEAEIDRMNETSQTIYAALLEDSDQGV
jgi:hypothetical protein